MADSELTKLRSACSRCHMRSKNAEALVVGYQAKLADVEARIQAIAPDLRLPPRFYKPNPIFARGELPGLALGIMREEGHSPRRHRFQILNDAKALGVRGARTTRQDVLSATRTADHGEGPYADYSGVM